MLTIEKLFGDGFLMPNQRRNVILKRVVEEYISTATPVGSALLSERHFSGYSPATIRNELAALEKNGYLTHPYTSAGRIPTERGYQYFVNRLMQPRAPERHLRSELEKVHEDPLALARHLSRFSRAAVLYFGNDYPLLQEGFREVLENPEFSERTKMLAFFDLVSRLCHRPNDLDSVLFSDRPRVLIGSQASFLGCRLDDFSIIAVRLNNGEKRVIGLAGPQRMRYDKNLGVLQYLKNIFQKYE